MFISSFAKVLKVFPETTTADVNVQQVNEKQSAKFFHLY